MIRTAHRSKQKKKIKEIKEGTGTCAINKRKGEIVK